jgi:hypothetical protein
MIAAALQSCCLPPNPMAAAAVNSTIKHAMQFAAEAHGSRQRSSCVWRLCGYASSCNCGMILAMYWLGATGP